jgi:hypothetical protein
MTLLVPVACAIAAYSVFLILLNIRALWRRPRWTAAFCAAALTLGAMSGSAQAHFIFVVPEPGADKAKVVMSETLKPDDDVDVKLISKIELSIRGGGGASETRVLLSGDPDKHHAYNVPLPGEGTRVIHGDVSLGVEAHGPKPFLLNYHPKTVVGDPFDSKTQLGGKIAKAEIIAIGKHGALVFQVLLDGKPVAKAKTTVIKPDGKERNVTTDADGKTEAFPQTGRFGVWARCVEPIAGTLDGKEFVETRHYPTLVVDLGSTDATPAQAAASKLPGGEVANAKTDVALASVDAKKYPKLPEATSSFGGVEVDGYLYVYGGHTAATHHYDTSAVSGKFNRLKLDGGTMWEPLESGPGLQGMNIAAHDGKIYRVGGMQPVNKPGDPEDIRSVADVARFDPAQGAWASLPPLPEPRSSHDIVFVGDKLYVLGGWNLKGAEGGKAWPSSALVLDLSSASPTWTSLRQPFARRALIAAVHQGKIYVIGGFDENDDPSLKVSVFDPVTEVWSDGPDLPGKARNGFAPAACVLNGRLYASVMDGSLLRLDEKANRWELVAKTTPRIVHRLVPHGDSILVIGGANHGGNFDLIEAVKPGAAAPVAESSAR